MRAGSPLFPPPPYHYHKCSGEEHYSKNVSAESETFICFLYISQYTPMLPRWWESHLVLPSLHHPLTSVISEGLKDRTQSRIFTQTPPHILGSQKSPGMAYCPGLHISFSPQLGTMFEQHTLSVLGEWGLEWLKSATWVYLTAIVLPFSRGSHHSQTPKILSALRLGES